MYDRSRHLALRCFSDILNNEDHPHHVSGAKIVYACPTGSEQFSLSRDRLEGFTDQVRDNFGVKILDSIEAVAERVDAILQISVDGRMHLEEFKRLAPFGKPVFIDKPLATSVADAKAILSCHSGTAHRHVVLGPVLENDRVGEDARSRL